MARHAPPVRIQCVAATVSGQSPASSSAPASTDFAPFYPHWTGHIGVSNYNEAAKTEPWRTYMGKKDTALLQSFYWSNSFLSDLNDTLTDIQGDYPHWRPFLYTLKQQYYMNPTSGETSNRRNSTIVIEDNSASSEFAAFSSAGDALWLRNQVGVRRMVNAAYEETPDVSGKNFAEHFYDANFDKLDGTTYSTGDLIPKVWGEFWDSMDLDDDFQPEVDDNNVRKNFDYAYNAGGPTDQSSARYREGTVAAVAYARGLQSTFAHYSNGGRDESQFDAGDSLSAHEWHQLWDGRLTENGLSKLGIARNGTNDGYVTQYNNPQNRLNILLRGAHISRAFVRPNATNTLKRRNVKVDFKLGHLGQSSPTESDMGDDEFFVMRMAHALCYMTDFMLPCVQFSFQYPCPILDEVIYDIGQPVGSRSIGTLSDTAFWTQRTADGNGFYYAVFDNGYWWWNGNNPDGNDVFPQTATDVATNLPTPPSGKVARKFNATPGQYTSALRGYGPSGQDTTLNDGSLVTSITARRWEGGMVIWADS